MVQKSKTEENYNKQISGLLDINSNNICIDCNIPNTQWASKTFGIFLCFDCTSTHRSLGVNTSFVKSISMDKWNKVEYLFMKLGGNEKFKQLVNKHNLHDKESNVLYLDPKVKKYGENLKSRVFEELGLDEEAYNKSQNKRKSDHIPKYNNSRIYEPPVVNKKNTIYDTLNAVSNSFISGVKEVKNKTFEYGEIIGRNVIIPSAMLLKSQTTSLTSLWKQNTKKEKEVENAFYKNEDDEKEDFSKWD